MKKSLFFVAAASALMLTACSSENDVLQSATPSQPVVQQKAVGFDVYTPAATEVTRTGLEGTMTTSRLQRSEYEGGGFGVYAFQVQDTEADAGYNHASTYVGKGYRTDPTPPNFMVNEKILWNATNMGWYYSPLKYWPNETDNDQQSTPAEMTTKTGSSDRHIDRLTFFAYAPYVSSTDPGVPGITRITNSDGQIANSVSGSAIYPGRVEPTIGYKSALTDPNKAVDLLWGVAPAGGLSYTAVNGQTVTVKEGEPLMDMTKPDVNTNMKFLFQHALARIGVTAVAAVDQVGAGGKLDPNTKITIEKITLTGWFGEQGFLNLDNEKANVANWTSIHGVDLKTNSAKTTVEGVSTGIFEGKPQVTLELVADHTANTDYSDDTDFANHQKGTIARHLQFVNIDNSVPDQNAVSEKPVEQKRRVGVTTVRQNVIMPAVIDNTLGANPGNRNWYTMKTYGNKELAYSETTPYYTDANCTVQPSAKVYYQGTNSVANAVKHVYQVNDKGVYTTNTTGVNLKYPQVNTYYDVTFKKVVSTVTDATKEILVAEAAGKQAYTQSGAEPSLTYTPKSVGIAPAENDYVIVGEITKAVAYYDGGTYYKRDANYFMVVPINNVPNICNITDTKELEKLRTVRVKIEYYITTEDSKLANGRAQTKNVIEKDVVFPHIANGKSYNLNLILGLTSVKMEAEVDDWKVVNVQGDLPQNTATE